MASSSSMWMVLAFLVITWNDCEGTDYLVGEGEFSWRPPLPHPERPNHWASARRFVIGDSLSWNYDQRSESILKVKEEDYHKCNTSNPLQEYNDGKAKVVLNRSGPFYFISGAQGHCGQGLKLHVRVLSCNYMESCQPWKKRLPPPPPTQAPSPAPVLEPRSPPPTQALSPAPVLEPRSPPPTQALSPAPVLEPRSPPPTKALSPPPVLAPAAAPTPAHFAVSPSPSQTNDASSSSGVLGITMGIGILLVMNKVFI